MTADPTDARAEAFGTVLRNHQPTTGMQVASGVTCRCGYWNGEEVAGKTRPVGYSGLQWHQAQMLALSTPQPAPASEQPFIALMPPSPETSRRWYTMYCRSCGIEEGMWATPDDPAALAHLAEHVHFTAPATEDDHSSETGNHLNATASVQAGLTEDDRDALKQRLRFGPPNIEEMIDALIADGWHR